MKNLSVNLTSLILFLTVSVYGQFTAQDYDLAEAVYMRNFDNTVFTEYLDSDDTAKINAALLGISHSADKSYIEKIINLNFSSHHEFICFALGGIGTSPHSSKYLYEKLRESRDGYSNDILEALGKTGSEEMLSTLIDDYFSGKTEEYGGISIALANYYFRDIGHPQVKEVLLNEIESESPLRQMEALYSLYRMGSDEDAADVLEEYLENASPESEQEINAVMYALANFRRLNTFPDNPGLLEKYAAHKSDLVRMESARTLVQFPFSDEAELDTYLALLDDENGNISRQAAIALSNISKVSIEAELRKALLEKISNIQRQESGIDHTAGELVLSALTLFPDNSREIIEAVSGKLPAPYVIRMTGEHYELFDDPFNLIIPEFDFYVLPLKLLAAQGLVNMQPAYIDDKSFRLYIVDLLKAEEPPVVSIIADGLDSAITAEHEAEIKEIITKQMKENLNDPDFIEALMSLHRLAGRISSEYGSSVKEMLLLSELYSVRKYADADKAGTRSPELFDALWLNAFKYSEAVLTTTKGEITIKLLPQYAPISTGNFVKLASEGFYDDVVFHRVVPGFVIQTGDPGGTGWGGPGYDIISEFSMLRYNTGMVGMASAGMDTEGSQWFIMQGIYPHLDGRYTIFAETVNGMDAVMNTEQNDKVIIVELYK